MDTWTCPHCHKTSHAIVQRTIAAPGETVRYRKCPHCHANFKTIERLFIDDLKALVVSRLFDLRVPADRVIEVLGAAPPEVIIKYLDALPAFQADRARRGDPIRSPGSFIAWAIKIGEPIPLPEPDQEAPIGATQEAAIEPPQPSIWDRALVEIEQTMTRATFDRWLRGTVMLERANSHILIGVRDKYAAEWCSTRLYPTIARTVSAMEGQPVEIVFQVI